MSGLALLFLFFDSVNRGDEARSRSIAFQAMAACWRSSSVRCSSSRTFRTRPQPSPRWKGRRRRPLRPAELKERMEMVDREQAARRLALTQ
jgi:hypothetical protein